MRKLVAVLSLLAGLALAQTTASHTVTVKVPPILQVSLDATDYLFDFTSSGTGSLTVGSVTYPKASQGNYITFLQTASGPSLFAPSSVAGTSNSYGTLTILSNQAQWTLKIESSGVNGNLTAPLSNSRVQVLTEQVSGKGSSSTTSPTPISPIGSSGLSLAQATSGGAGKSVYKLYYFLQMDPNDEFPSSTYSGQITVTLKIVSP